MKLCFKTVQHRQSPYIIIYNIKGCQAGLTPALAAAKGYNSSSLLYRIFL